MIANILAVGVGGALGSVVRYLIGLAIKTEPGSLPWATILINISGSGLLGFLAGRLPPNQYLLWGTGFLSGYTTFSAFSVESYRLIAEGHVVTGLLNMILPVVLGLGAAALGFYAAQKFY